MYSYKTKTTQFVNDIKPHKFQYLQLHFSKLRDYLLYSPVFTRVNCILTNPM